MTAPQAAPVLYIVERVPRASETFTFREVLAPEARGERVLVDVLLPPVEGPRHADPDQLRAPVRLLPRHPRLRDPQVARAHLRLAARAPGRWLALAGRAAGDPEAWGRFLQAGLVARRLRQEGARRVHAYDATPAAVVARDAGVLAGVPVTVTAHTEGAPHEANALPPTRRLQSVGAATGHHACQLRKVRPRTRVGRRPGVVLCVSRLVPGNGIDTLVTAVGLLADDRPGLRLEIIGDGPLDAALRGQVRELGLEDRVHFRGPLASAEVRAALSRCAMLALPRGVDTGDDRDGLPTVLLEALACRTPVVTTRVPGVPELVRDGETGLHVAPEGPIGLAVAIAALLDDRDRGAARPPRVAGERCRLGGRRDG